MRITNNMLIRNMVNNLNTNLQRMDKVQQQMSTGKKFQLPSDDPIGVSKSLRYHTDLARIDQYKRNVNDATSWLEVTEDAMVQVGDILQRARELTVQASNGTNGSSDLEQISPEIKQLKEQLIKVANTTYAGRQVFSGFKTDQALLDENGKYQPGNLRIEAMDIEVINPNEDPADPNDDTITKTLEPERMRYNVGVAEEISVNIVGMEIFGTVEDQYDAKVVNKSTDGTPVADGNKQKSYLIDIFDQLETALTTNDTDGVEGTLEKLDASLDNLLMKRAELGAKANRLELTGNKLEAQNITFTKLLSENEDVDMAKVIMDLKVQENVYRASLSSGAKVIQPTLIDFLR